MVRFQLGYAMGSVGGQVFVVDVTRGLKRKTVTCFNG